MTLSLSGTLKAPRESNLTPIKSESLGVAPGHQVLEFPREAVLVGMKGKLEALFLH